MLRALSISIVTLLFSQSGFSVTICESLQKTSKGQPKYTVEFYKAHEMKGGTNSFATILLSETERMGLSGNPTYYQLCTTKPSAYGMLVSCEGTMGNFATLMVENVSRAGAFQDGPFQLFNMKCSR